MKYKSLKGTHPYYMGIRGVYFIWHGTNCDPELSYKGMTVNYYEVENTLWQDFKELTGGFDEKVEDIMFQQYCKSNAQEVKDLITAIDKQHEQKVNDALDKLYNRKQS